MKSKFNKIIFVIPILLLTALVSAQTTVQTCLDANTLQRITYTTICDNANCNTINTTSNDNCQFGCDASKSNCIDNPGLDPMIYMFFFAIAFIVFFVTFTNVIEVGNEPRLVLFVISTMLFAILVFSSFNVASQSQTMNLVLVAVNFGFMILSLLYIINEAFQMFKGR